jgi:hypothetical protein
MERMEGEVNLILSVMVITVSVLTVSAERADTVFNDVTTPSVNDSFLYTSSFGKTYSAILPKDRLPTDYTPLGFTRQPSFVRGAGLLNKREHAFVLYADGDIIPPPLMLGYRYGMFYWWDFGVDIGADKGIFQTFVRTRLENLKTRKSEAFLWSNEFAAGFKNHNIDLGQNLRFDDRSFVFTADNALASRLGKARTKSLYLLTVLYVDYDLHSPRRQTDYYVEPAVLGFETMAGEYTNFFVELGAAYSINGTQFGDNSKLCEKTWFPVFRIGTALRTGKQTAIYYTRETKPLSRGVQPKEVK